MYNLMRAGLTGLLCLIMMPGMPALGSDAPATESRDVITAEAANPETYPDWSAIKTLVETASAAKEPAMKSITEWNAQAEACHLPPARIVTAGFWYRDCKQLFTAIDDGRVSAYLVQCRQYAATYNRLARNFLAAQASQFVNRQLVGVSLVEAMRTFREFCGAESIETKFPKMAEVMQVRKTEFNPITLHNSVAPAFADLMPRCVGCTVDVQPYATLLFP